MDSGIVGVWVEIEGKIFWQRPMGQFDSRFHPYSIQPFSAGMNTRNTGMHVGDGQLLLCKITFEFHFYICELGFGHIKSLKHYRQSKSCWVLFVRGGASKKSKLDLQIEWSMGTSQEEEEYGNEAGKHFSVFNFFLTMTTSDLIEPQPNLNEFG